LQIFNLKGVLNGFNAAIIAYGQTGSGKTFTMQGPAFDKNSVSWQNPTEKWGIIPRMVGAMFEKVEKCDPNEEYMIVASVSILFRFSINCHSMLKSTWKR
jgi:hypothetical protein